MKSLNYSPRQLRVLALLTLLSKEPLETRVRIVEMARLGDLKEECIHKVCERLANDALVNRTEDEIIALSSRGIGVLGIGDKEYRSLLKQVYDPPLILYFRGELNRKIGERTAVAIVGSRNSDLVGGELAQHFGCGLAEAGAIVVSGLAYGIDAAAHRGSLRSGNDFPTIAVLGNGLDSVYPRAHKKLADEILARGGLLISQFEPDTQPFPSNFLNRNRVISGMSEGVLVIQAAERSGSLVTARHAVDEGREVMVLPGAVNDARYGGSNRLLKQGATLITSIEDIYEVLPQLTRIRKSKEESTFTPLQKKLVIAIQSSGSLGFEALLETVPERGALERELLALELSNIIVRGPGNIFIKKP